MGSGTGRRAGGRYFLDTKQDPCADIPAGSRIRSMLHLFFSPCSHGALLFGIDHPLVRTATYCSPPSVLSCRFSFAFFREERRVSCGSYPVLSHPLVRTATYCSPHFQSLCGLFSAFCLFIRPSRRDGYRFGVFLFFFFRNRPAAVRRIRKRAVLPDRPYRRRSMYYSFSALGPCGVSMIFQPRAVISSRMRSASAKFFALRAA